MQVRTDRRRAFLIDVFDTVLSFDFVQYQAALAAHAGVATAAFSDSAVLWADRVMDGSASLATVFEEILRGSGAATDPERIADLVAVDRRLVQELATVHPDAVPFLESLRADGVRTAFVSNCSDNTRPLLEATGLAGLVDELVLSCEVGAAKPAAAIFETALERLGATPEEAVFVDDQRRHCDGAAALGITAVHLRRSGGGDVRSLAELDRYL